MSKSTPSKAASSVWESGDLQRDILGRRVHQVIGAALASGDHHHRTIHRLARGFGSEDGSAARLLSPRQLVVTLASVYFHRFALPTSWIPVGSELVVGQSRLDVVWLHHSGRVLVDEIKTRIATIEMESVRGQLERYRRAGLMGWKERFVGVRLCPLRNPSAAAVLLANGTVAADLRTQGGVA